MAAGKRSLAPGGAGCLSGACLDSTCALGCSGAACGVDEDCAEGLSCKLGVCKLP